MIDHNNEMRMSDEELQQFAENILFDYELETRNGVFVISQTPLAVRELVLRELERRKKKEEDDKDD